MNEIISNAIEYCCNSSYHCKNASDIVERLKTQDNIVHSRFRNSIASDINNYIVHNYGNVIKDIRLFGSTMEYQAGKYSDIDIIVHVENFGGEILESIKRLDLLLTNEYYGLIQEAIDQYSYLIDPHIIDDNLKSQPDPSKAYLMHIIKNDSMAISKL